MNKGKDIFLQIKNKLVLLAAVSAGLYPLINLYKSNHTLLASWYQFVGLMFIFIGLPILVFTVIILIANSFESLKKYRIQILTFMNLAVFACLIVRGSYGFNKKLLLAVFLIMFALSFVLKKHIKKIIKFQFLLAVVGLFFMIPVLSKYLNYNSDWKTQIDHIESVKFKTKPNIYFIQPDGYIGLSEIDKGNYRKDNSDFNAFLVDNDFKLYPKFRSNYYSTLSSNSSVFAMKHHYYNHSADVDSELLFARDVIIGDNPVLSILKNNGYKSNLIMENAYLLTSRPKNSFDYCNIDLNEIPILTNGFGFKKDVTSDLEIALKNNGNSNNFYFIERIIPGHIATLQSYTMGKEGERNKYLKKIDEANLWIKETLALIKKYDSNSLIVIAADHGGFVGYEYSSQSHEKPKNRDNTYSMFSTLLAIKWTEDASQYDRDLNTSVNLFRTVFSFLSEDKSLLDNFEDDRSYLKVSEGAPLGIYEVIDDNDNMVFEELEKDKN
ncbi:hypothetical protein [Winogradskyella sp.]|uniref:hypothetical protein n=1 Tax=Winogradskyella sp. TaxID=1883156 RepID=UPI0025FCB17C|nr:hypothetical protein [Winogradskyella sp.]